MPISLLSRGLKILLALLAGYVIMTLLLSSMTVNGERGIQPPLPTAPVTLWLMSNGVHTDLVLPVRHPLRDWGQFLPWRPDQPNGLQHTDYVAIGWGDRGFYLETPTWAELKASTALKAISGTGQTLMHVTAINGPLHEDTHTRRLTVSPQQYQQLLGYIDQQFVLDQAGKPQAVMGQYGLNDRFYAARGSYSLFQTCNSWVVTGLKVMGQPAPVWTPFDRPILSRYPIHPTPATTVQ